MRLGIDLGTTRTVVARVDRGNYPVVMVSDTEGDARDFVPTVAALVDEDLVYGFEALAAAKKGAGLLRSFKRLLGEPSTTLGTGVDIGGREVPLLDILTGFLQALRQQVHASLGRTAADGPDEVVVSVPAHAHTAQRYLTIEAFRRAGFEVLALVNEPSAAGFEYTHRRPGKVSAKRSQVLVYDLGGGTFDASLVRADGGAHEILGSVGINRLGGDDVDVVLAEVALAAAPEAVRTAMTRAQWRQLLDEAREAKERLTPQSRRIALEVGGEGVVVMVDEFYASVAPLVQRTIGAMAPLVQGLEGGQAAGALAEVAGLYLVGGGSELPLVPRMLRERFGRRVQRSPYPAAATAIGLAIAADPDVGFTLNDRLSRGFGVFRERSGGAALDFDEIFSRDVELPASGEISVTRRYCAVHDIGWFRYVEYSRLDEAGEPAGELHPFAEVLFPFDAALRDGRDLAELPVRRRGVGPEIEERYTLDASGMLQVRITDLDTGYSRTYGLR